MQCDPHAIHNKAACKQKSKYNDRKHFGRWLRRSWRKRGGRGKRGTRHCHPVVNVVFGSGGGAQRQLLPSYDECPPTPSWAEPWQEHWLINISARWPEERGGWQGEGRNTGGGSSTRQAGRQATCVFATNPCGVAIAADNGAKCRTSSAQEGEKSTSNGEWGGATGLGGKSASADDACWGRFCLDSTCH